MDLFSKIGSLLKEKPSDSIMDDNIAVSATDNNPYMSTVALGARNAYDTLHMLMVPLIKGKKSSLKQIDKWLDDWIGRLEEIEKMYEELLSKLNDLGADFTSAFDLDFAKEAWEIIQDTPILRRYMGEANYWLLYDTLGILSTQTGSLAGDLLASVKSAIKEAILALVSMTDGILCLESYLGMIQQYWGALYLKITPIPLLDSIVPNVTCAYWYKSPISSVSNGEQHKITLSNDPPGQGFTPLPLPVPNPVMVTRDPSYIGKFDYQNPDTWYLNDTPYYLPNTMNLLERALQYWGSSYTNEFLPGLNNFYTRRPYGEGEAHPLRVGHTLEQLDTSKMSLNGTNVALKEEGKPSVDEIFAAVFTERTLYYMTTESWVGTDNLGNAVIRSGWQAAYEKAYRLLLEFVLDGFTAYGESPSTITRFWSLQRGDSSGTYPQYSAWIAGTADNTWTSEQIQGSYDFRKAIEDMYWSWKNIVGSSGIPGENRYQVFFDAMMKAFVDAGRLVNGFDGSLGETELYMVSPSFFPVNIGLVDEDTSRNMGIPCVAYKADYTQGTVYEISSGLGTTSPNDTVKGRYPVSKVGFVMLPSDDTDMDTFMYRVLGFNCVAKSTASTLVNLPDGLSVGSPIGTEGTVMEYSFGMMITPGTGGVVGELTDALYMHRSCGLLEAKEIDKSSIYLGNIFFPDGKVPSSLEDAKTPDTFVSHYLSFSESATDANEELADIIGYAIDHGRESKFPCFGVYGELLSMQSWHYTEMQYSDFVDNYEKVKPGSSLYYELSNPEHIVFYHSSYMSQTRQMQMAVIHESLDSTRKSYGANDKYTFYVFPTESISVTKLSDSPSLGSFLSTDAESPSGEAYHYITMRNPIPKCAKYVDPEKWSIMDIIHEMYLLASNLAGLCGDNGERLMQLQDDLSEFHISTPQFIGQLPINNGQYSPFRFEIFKDYSDKIEKLVNSVYDFRAKIVAVTEAW